MTQLWREDDRAARAAWSRIAEPGDPVAHRLLEAVGPCQALAALADRSDEVLDRFRPRFARLDVLDDLARAKSVGVRLVCPADPDWPDGVDDLDVPPVCLWVRGPLVLAGACGRSVAIVGARAASSYGEWVAGELAAGVAQRGFTVVSGAAFGVDGAAHRGVLAVDGPTVAVLAGGLDRPYPAAHADLIGRIGDVGAVVSEVPPGCPPTKSRFLQRNRLIASMTAGTVVVEAGLRSGARNTAGTAGRHHRVVMAVPGPVTSPTSAGCHELIRSGLAVLVSDAAEVADAVGIVGADLAPARRGEDRPGDEMASGDRRVLDALRPRRPTTPAQMAIDAGVGVLAATAALGRLELAGLAERAEGGWRLTRRSRSR